MTKAVEKYRILVADAGYDAAIADLARDFPNLDILGASDESDAAALASDNIVGVIAGAATIDDSLLGKMGNLRAVLKLGRSYFNIDVDAVRRRGLHFGCVPRKGPNCVAELALTLIMALSKDLVVGNEAVSLGAYRYRGSKPELTSQRKIAFHWMKNERVHEVTSKTLGIIGMGEIGCELARRASVMGMRNLYYKRTPLSAELEQCFDASYRDLDDLLRESDYVCVATPHTAQTEGLDRRRADRAHERKRLSGQYRARRHHRRRGDDRGAARQPHRRRRPGCLYLRALTAGKSDLRAGQRDPLPAYRRRHGYQS